MTTLESIQQSIERLTAEEVARLNAWIDDLQERLFDEAIERDAKSGKLDVLAERALADHKAGRTRPRIDRSAPL
jgi:hypothetical protein